jgi:protein involved in polysaccharide export with SLBB domain
MTQTKKRGARGREAARTMGLLLALLAGSPGCVTGIPARRVPRELLATTRADTTPIDMVRLRQDPPAAYLVEARDILGIYIEGVLGGGTEQTAAPPVQNPERGGLPPAIGYPIAVREDGTISLPLVESIRVSGMTVAEIERAIRDEYTVKRNILPRNKDRLIVTLMRRRTYQVIVVREDATGLANSAGAATANALQAGSTNQSFRLPVPAWIE